jgi:hypothetical protein
VFLLTFKILGHRFDHLIKRVVFGIVVGHTDGVVGCGHEIGGGGSTKKRLDCEGRRR